ncbi:hypothetical protein Scep_027104 [Stephania cephalantha]|uniref:Replication protein A subunit n=1 Tax=Stephania cephalantha TaxID=152367 RepID=A0AAP0ELE0_9MAGN
MAVNLTSNAIEMICNGEFQGDDAKPVVQVADIKLVTTGQQSTERYRMLLSDGAHLQQGMLATQLNGLVQAGKVQKGSVIQMSQFVSQVIQGRQIIIIIDLNVILENCNPIGDPKLYARGSAATTASVQGRQSISGQSPMEQSRVTAANTQSYGGAVGTTGRLPLKDVNGGASMQHPNLNSQNSGGGYAGNSDSRGPGYAANNVSPAVYPKSEPGARVPGSAPLAGSYGDRNQSFVIPKTEGGFQPPSNTYGRPMQSMYQSPPNYVNRGPIAKNEAPARIIPIAALNPYQGRWTIKARVTSKKDLRRYNNARGEGKVFSFDLLDSDGGEIQVTCFNAVADQFYDQIEAGKVYLISRGTLKPASKNFNRLQNEYEIYLESTSSIQPCMEDDASIPRQQFHFRPISDIESMENGSIVDLIGVVSSVSLTVSIMKKDGTETLKRALQLKDMSGCSVEITLWGNVCNAEGQQLQNMCDSGIFPVLAVKAGRINDFNGKSVGTLSTSQLFIDPDFPEARKLKEWFELEGKNVSSVSLSRETMGTGRTEVRKTVSQIKDERLGTSEKPDWISIKGTISFLKADNFCYTACPLMVGDRPCNKKVTNNGDGQWRCDRCDQSVAECDYRYILQFQIQDHTGITWVTAFQESGVEILGLSAKDLYYLKFEEQDDEKFADIIRKALFTPFIFKLKVKEETFSDEQRVKSTVVKAEKVDVSSESKFLLDLIDKLAGEDLSTFPVSAANNVPDSAMNNFGHNNSGIKQSAVANSMGSYNTGRDGGAFANQAGSYGNQYNSGGGSGMSGTGVYIYCNSCRGTGHNAKNCPSNVSRQGEPMGGGYGSGGGYGGSGGGGGGGGYGGNRPSGTSGECFKCHQTGHWARDCPGTNTAPPVYGSGGASGGRYGGGAPRQWSGY